MKKLLITTSLAAFTLTSAQAHADWGELAVGLAGGMIAGAIAAQAMQPHVVYVPYAVGPRRAARLAPRPAAKAAPKRAANHGAPAPKAATKEVEDYDKRIDGKCSAKIGGENATCASFALYTKWPTYGVDYTFSTKPIEVLSFGGVKDAQPDLEHYQLTINRITFADGRVVPAQGHCTSTSNADATSVTKVVCNVTAQGGMRFEVELTGGDNNVKDVTKEVQTGHPDNETPAPSAASAPVPTAGDFPPAPTDESDFDHQWGFYKKAVHDQHPVSKCETDGVCESRWMADLNGDADRVVVAEGTTKEHRTYHYFCVGHPKATQEMIRRCYEDDGSVQDQLFSNNSSNWLNDKVIAAPFDERNMVDKSKAARAADNPKAAPATAPAANSSCAAKDGVCYDASH